MKMRMTSGDNPHSLVLTIFSYMYSYTPAISASLAASLNFLQHSCLIHLILFLWLLSDSYLWQ